MNFRVISFFEARLFFLFFGIRWLLGLGLSGYECFGGGVLYIDVYGKELVFSFRVLERLCLFIVIIGFLS